MSARRSYQLLLLALIGATTAAAQDSREDIVAGEKLYIAQCKLCHGSAAPETVQRLPLQPRSTVQLAARTPAAVTDVPNPLLLSEGGPQGTIGHNTGAPDGGALLAFAPPFGPTLRGVYGRPAGSVSGFDYSSAFMASIKGMEWNDAALDVWITNPQAWVPGVYMYYKQPDAEVRRKIIAYLRANH
jgi:cytochrome c2